MKEEMRMQFVNAEQLVNISYDGVMYDLEVSLILFHPILASSFTL